MTNSESSGAAGPRREIFLSLFALRISLVSFLSRETNKYPYILNGGWLVEWPPTPIGQTGAPSHSRYTRRTCNHAVSGLNEADRGLMWLLAPIHGRFPKI